jgi:hypothetical protein
VAEFTTDDIHINAGNLLSRQICVPKEMTISQATHLLNIKDICGTTNGWVYRDNLGEVDCAEKPTHKHLVFVA